MLAPHNNTSNPAPSKSPVAMTTFRNRVPAAATSASESRPDDTAAPMEFWYTEPQLTSVPPWMPAAAAASELFT